MCFMSNLGSALEEVGYLPRAADEAPPCPRTFGLLLVAGMDQPQADQAKSLAKVISFF